MDNKLQQQIYKALESVDSMDSALELLREFKRMGGEKREALIVLEVMREVSPELDDEILEVMDFVTGFCRLENRVW